MRTVRIRSSFRIVIMHLIRWIFAVICLLVTLSARIGTFVRESNADDLNNIPVTIKDHCFIPSEIHVAAGKPVVLIISNEDPTVEEFDSPALKIEKVIAGGTFGSVRLRPLGPGRYPFSGEYHPDTAQGVVISE
jgi:plastocyanin domain-containing protein